MIRGSGQGERRTVSPSPRPRATLERADDVGGDPPAVEAPCLGMRPLPVYGAHQPRRVPAHRTRQGGEPRCGPRVRPHRRGLGPVLSGHDVPIGRRPLPLAERRRRGRRPQHTLHDVVPREVPARRMEGLEHPPRPPALGDQARAEADHHVPRAGHEHRRPGIVPPDSCPSPTGSGCNRRHATTSILPAIPRARLANTDDLDDRISVDKAVGLIGKRIVATGRADTTGGAAPRFTARRPSGEVVHSGRQTDDRAGCDTFARGLILDAAAGTDGRWARSTQQPAGIKSSRRILFVDAETKPIGVPRWPSRAFAGTSSRSR